MYLGSFNWLIIQLIMRLFISFLDDDCIIISSCIFLIKKMNRSLIKIFTISCAMIVLSGCIARDYSWTEWTHSEKGESVFYADKLNCINNARQSSPVTSYIRDCLRAKGWRMQ